MTITAKPVGASVARAHRARMRRNDLAGYAFLSPWLLGLILLTAGPMLASLYLSFTDYNLFDAPNWIGVDNYVALFQDERWLQSVRVTAIYVVLAVPIKLAASLLIAMLLNKAHRGVGLYRSAFYLPSLVGASVSIAIVWKTIFSDGGAVDRIQQLLGVDIGGWTGNPQLATTMLVLLAVWQFGAPLVIFLAGLKQIPLELYEAASVDGAGAFRRFFSITIPMLTPIIFFNLVLETIAAFQVFASAFIISSGSGGPAGATNLYTLYLYIRGFGDLRMGYASAMAWVLLIVVGVIAALIFRSARSWVHYEDGQN